MGHLSADVLSAYVHMADTTIAQRKGRASIAESLLGDARVIRRRL